jgi:hypothetical protein
MLAGAFNNQMPDVRHQRTLDQPPRNTQPRYNSTLSP